MLRKIILTAILFTSLVACRKAGSAFKYSQDLVAIEKSLHADIDSTEKKVGRYTDNNQYDSIVFASTGMESLLQKKMDDIDQMPMPDAKGVNEFKAEVMNYFKFLKNKYTVYRSWAAASTEAERAAALQKIQEIVDNVDAMIGKMQVAQEKYAELNGFRIKK